MIFGIQILGLLFGLIMVYFTFLYYKRKEYDKFSFLLWILIWLFYIFMVMIPAVLYSFMELLKVERTVDFFVIGGFFIFSIIVFYLYVVTKRNERRIENLVRNFALMEYKKANGKKSK